MVDNKEKEVWDKYGAIQRDKEFKLGSYYSYQLRNSPRHILFTLARYKFAMKMIGAGKDILELGCNEGLGAIYLSEFANSFKGVDFDSDAVKWAESNVANERISFANDNFLGKTYGSFDAVVSYDVIEHIYNDKEDLYIQTLLQNMKTTGVCILGTPTVEGQRFANSDIAGAHVNLYSGDSFYEMLNRYFHNVFLFSQNDEIIHTGHTPMAHYLIAVCCGKKVDG